MRLVSVLQNMSKRVFSFVRHFVSVVPMFGYFATERYQGGKLSFKFGKAFTTISWMVILIVGRVFGAGLFLMRVSM